MKLPKSIRPLVPLVVLGIIGTNSYAELSPNERLRIRIFGYSITFFELTNSGALDPVITTVLDDYSSGTPMFIAVRSSHETSAFKRALAVQDLGTCVPE